MITDMADAAQVTQSTPKSSPASTSPADLSQKAAAIDSVNLSVPTATPASTAIAQANSSRIMGRLRSSFSPTVKKVLQQSRVGTAKIKSDLKIARPDEKAQSSQVSKKPSLSSKDKLEVLDQAITQAEELVKKEVVKDAVKNETITVTQKSTPTTITQTSMPATVAKKSEPILNPVAPTPTNKETETTRGIDQISPDSGSGVQYVEHEKSPEIPVEVENFLHRLEDHADQLPQEIVVADDDADIANMKDYPATPVVVLPITPEIEKKGKKKNHHWSIRWLVEWSEKIIKMFRGKVIYREVGEL